MKHSVILPRKTVLRSVQTMAKVIETDPPGRPKPRAVVSATTSGPKTSAALLQPPVDQHELPSTLPSPGKTLGMLTLQALGHTDDWSVVFEKTDEQNSNLSNLSKQIAQGHFHLEAKLKSFAEKNKRTI